MRIHEKERREAEQRGMNGSWEHCYYSCTTMGTVPSLETQCPTCVHPCDQTIILGDCLSTSKTKRFVKRTGGDFVPRSQMGLLNLNMQHRMFVAPDVAEGVSAFGRCLELWGVCIFASPDRDESP